VASDEVLSERPLVTIKNTFLHVDMGKPTSSLKQVSTWGGALCTTDEEDTAEGALADSGRGSSGGSDGDGEAEFIVRSEADRLAVGVRRGADHLKRIRTHGLPCCAAAGDGE
jgi:hypothetical protein